MMDYDPNEDHFSDDNKDIDDKVTKMKMIKYMKSCESEITVCLLWLGHCIIGMIPTVLDFQDAIGTAVSFMATSIFMITM